MKFILKILMGFALVMCILFLILVIINHTQVCLIVALCLASLSGCYFLGDFALKVIDDVLKEWK